MSSKNEQPTSRRLEEAKRRGQFPRSPMLNAAVAIGGATWVAIIGGESWVKRLASWSAQLWSEPEVTVTSAMQQGLLIFAGPAVALSLAAAVPVALVGFFTTRGFFNPDHLLPKLENLDPTRAFRRLASSGHWLGLAKGIVASALVLYFVWTGGTDLLRYSLGNASAAVTLGALSAGLAGAVQTLLVLGLVLGAADFALELRRHRQGLMMSRDEVRREHRQAEGDPHLKARRQSRHRQLLAGGTKQGVRQANVVVVNPTHIAVALRYDDQECEAPYLVAKGRDDHALAIRAEAKAAGIAIIRDVPLARSLIHFELGEEIPEELYQAAAAVLKEALGRSPLHEGVHR